MTAKTHPSKLEDSRIPVTILTGFLGSGKTTLLNNLVKSSFWERVLKSPPLTAVIMNEFGSIGLDHQMIENMQGPIALLDGGCVCCEIQGTLLPTLKNLWMAKSDGTVPAYERIIIETTGVADPTSIMETLLNSGWASRRHYLDGIVTTVDAVFANQQLDKHFEAVRQVSTADKLLLTKTDLADEDAITQIKDRLRKLNLSAEIVPVTHGEADPDEIYNLRAYHQSDVNDAKQWLSVDKFTLIKPIAQKLKHGGVRNPKATASPGVDGRIRSFSLVFEEPLAWQGVADALETITGLCSHRLLRMKAIVNIKEYPDQPIVLHAVQHIFYPSIKLPEWPDDDRNSRFVFITADLDEEFVSNLLKTFTDSVQPTAVLD